MRPRMSQDETFWRIVKDLDWKLDDGRGRQAAVAEPEFNHGARPPMTVPAWTTLLLAFLFGALSLGMFLVAPALLATLALWTVGCLGVLSLFRRR